MFNPDFPDTCPPNDAQPANSTVYRQVNELPICEDHFLSHVELQKGRFDPTNCEHWGCSVWVDKEGVDHARSLIPHFRQTYILAGQVDHNDGVIKHTPKQKQERHHTFWKFFGHSVCAKFQVALNPNEEWV